MRSTCERQLILVFVVICPAAQDVQLGIGWRELERAEPAVSE